MHAWESNPLAIGSGLWGCATLRRQWSFPLDLPLPLLGIFRARVLPMSDADAADVPWADEIRFENLSEHIGFAPYTEARTHGSSTAYCAHAGLPCSAMRCVYGAACRARGVVHLLDCSGGAMVCVSANA